MPTAVKLARFRRERYATIPVPISRRTRVASLSANKIQTGHLRRFSLQSWPEIETFRPQVLMGRMDDLRRLANLSETAIIDLSSVDTAIFVTAEPGSTPISDVERVVLWQSLGVPVYELLITNTGHLIGSECEAHAGWHVERRMQNDPHVISLPSIDSTPCACGRKEPRIVAHSGPHLIRVLAATA